MTKKFSLGVTLAQTTLQLGLLILGIYILAVEAGVWIVPYVVLLILLYSVFRYYLCTRCEYYGTHCPSFGLGIYTSRIFPQQEGKSINIPVGAVDILSFFVVLFYPIPWLVNSIPLLILYLILLVSFFAVKSYTGCRYCNKDFCPLSTMSRKMFGTPQG